MSERELLIEQLGNTAEIEEMPEWSIRAILLVMIVTRAIMRFLLAAPTLLLKRISPVTPPPVEGELIVEREKSEIDESAQMFSLTALATESQFFWAGKPLEQLRRVQQPVTVSSLQELVVDCWPEDESVDDFLNFLSEQRRASVER